MFRRADIQGEASPAAKCYTPPSELSTRFLRTPEEERPPHY